jgi:hypothetical protein
MACVKNGRPLACVERRRPGRHLVGARVLALGCGRLNGGHRRLSCVKDGRRLACVKGILHRHPGMKAGRLVCAEAQDV